MIDEGHYGLNMAFQKSLQNLDNITYFAQEASRCLHVRCSREHARESKMNNSSFRKVNFPHGKPISSNT